MFHVSTEKSRIHRYPAKPLNVKQLFSPPFPHTHALPSCSIQSLLSAHDTTSHLYYHWVSIIHYLNDSPTKYHYVSVGPLPQCSCCQFFLLIDASCWGYSWGTTIQLNSLPHGSQEQTTSSFLFHFFLNVCQKCQNCSILYP